MTTHIASRKSFRWASAALVLALLQGCATGPNANPADPLEPLNRTVFQFNDGLDRAVIKPVATAYQNGTPALVRTGVTNFFGNISDVWSVVNNVLQAKPQAAVNSFFRVTTNTLWGLGGIFDVASDMRIPKHSESFGQTLGHWGVASGPYLVLPVFGPSNVRDSFGRLVDAQGDLVAQGVNNISVRNSLGGLRLVNLRASLLGVDDFLEQASLDKYTFARDIYMQRHRSSRAVDAPPEERYDLPEGASGTGLPAAPAPASK
ncbi:MAG: VacJ family lipoprotein [Polaromonas sp.]|nr:VacJ family lipoprotein [Polaromonas sp.]